MTCDRLSAYWREHQGPPRRGARWVRPIAGPVVRAAWRVRMHGARNIPAHGPVILAVNHTSVLDGPLVYAVSQRPVHALVKHEMFRGIVGRALTGLGQVSVEREALDVRAIKDCLAVLERGDVLAIYPEGTRGAGDFARIRPGVAYLGLCTGAPIVPVACLGVRRVGESVGRLPAPRSPLDVVVGEPISLAPVATPPMPWPRRSEAVAEASAWLRRGLAAHVKEACELTGVELPGAAPDWPDEEPDPTVGPSTDRTRRNDEQ